MSSSARVPLSGVRDLLLPGQPVPFSVYDGEGRLLLAKGQPILNVEQLQSLLQRGASVQPEDAEAVRAARQAAVKGAGFTPSTRRLTLFDHWEKQVWGLDRALRLVGRDTQQAPTLLAQVDELLALINSHADAALFVAVRQDDHRYALYGLAHSVHTAVVAMLCARQLGWDTARVQSVAAAALTMNVSMLELQATMAEQKDPPTKKQLDVIRTHTERSAQMLRISGVADEDWLAAVTDHHERSDASGYPRGVAEVGETARLLRVCDVFMAKISPRAFRTPMGPQAAARQLFQEEKGGPLAAALIQALGVHPPGDFVLLKNGEIGVVTHRGASPTTPRVVVLLDAGGRAVSGTVVRDTAAPGFGVAGVPPLQTKLPRVLPERVYGLVYV